MTLRQKVQNRQGGFIVSIELMLIATILVIGMIVGMVAVRDAMVAELHDVAEALGEMDQSFVFQGLRDPQNGAATSPSSFNDEVDDLTDGGTNQGGATLGGDDVGLDFVAPDGEETQTFVAGPIGDAG